MPKTKKKQTKPKRQVKVGKGKGSGNIDIRVNVGGAREPFSKYTAEEKRWAARHKIPLSALSALRGYPYNYPNQRLKQPVATSTGGGQGLSGYVQQPKSANKTETHGDLPSSIAKAIMDEKERRKRTSGLTEAPPPSAQRAFASGTSGAEPVPPADRTEVPNNGPSPPPRRPRGAPPAAPPRRAARTLFEPSGAAVSESPIGTGGASAGIGTSGVPPVSRGGNIFSVSSSSSQPIPEEEPPELGEPEDPLAGVDPAFIAAQERISNRQAARMAQGLPVIHEGELMN